MSGLGILNMLYIGVVLEGFCFGLYSAIFFIYIQYQASRELGIDRKSVLFYALCILYVLSIVTVVLDIIGLIVLSKIVSLSPSPTSLVLQALHLSYPSITINGLCDFISQAILIYRCWVVWNRNIRVIIIPSILALTFLATWLACNCSIYIIPDAEGLYTTYWGYTVTLTSLAVSLTVNAVVTGLIELRIIQVYWQVASTFKRTLVVGGHNPKLRSIIFIIIESGMVLFAIQLIRIVLSILNLDAVKIMIGISQMFNGITPTIILVRVSAGSSFHDEKSMSEIVETLRFGTSHNEDSPSETGAVEIVGVDRSIQQGGDIEIVDR